VGRSDKTRLRRDSTLAIASPGEGGRAQHELLRRVRMALGDEEPPADD